ncbi:MAG: hypothetical protein HYX92_08240 [Chloroflexi bacterium]|nr:hypothetical protein [Chloroflexota bacterium]
MQGSGLTFEDVSEGTEIPSEVNRIEFIDMLKYAAGYYSFYLVHLDRLFAKEQGYEDANIQGPFYGALCARMLTDWIGVGGRLKKLAFSVRIMGFPGDTLTCKGKVVKKYVRDGDNLADCEIWVENQRGEKVAPGSATVSLPGRGG